MPPSRQFLGPAVILVLFVFSTLTPLGVSQFDDAEAGHPIELQNRGRAEAGGNQVNLSAGEWLATSNGSNREYARAISTVAGFDSQGNSVTWTAIGGTFRGEAQFGNTILRHTRDTERTFLALLNDSGGWEWAVDFGGDAGHDWMSSIAVQPSGGVFVTGITSDTATGGEFGNFSLNSTGSYLGLVDPIGIWQWVRPLVNITSDEIRLDSQGNLFLSGALGAGEREVLQWTINQSNSVIVLKMDTAFNWLWFATSQATTFDRAHGLGIDSNGDAYICGYYQQETWFGSTNLSSGPGSYIYVAKLSGSSGTWMWANHETSGGSGGSSCNGLSVDPATGDAILTGKLQGSATMGDRITSLGGGDGFISKINSTGFWKWAEEVGGQGNEIGYGIAYGWNQTAAVVGQFSQDTRIAGVQHSNSGGYDGFAALHDRNGYGLDSFTVGSQFFDQIYAVGADRHGDFTFVGRFNNRTQLGPHALNTSSSSSIFVWHVPLDSDDDGSINKLDNCPDMHNPTQDDFDLDAAGDTCDSDDDGDGVPDSTDACLWGVINWNSSSSSDHDSDGCRDGDEDDDDDDDGVLDSADSCYRGSLNWFSDSLRDYDGDGCRDSDEDLDDDDDLILDDDDNCQTGQLNWTSDSTNDHDQDGCRDGDEDDDDDGDRVEDGADRCRLGMTDWTSLRSTDWDTDGCRDDGEDDDDDDDLVLDSDDDCLMSRVGWTSSPSTDHDGDGCEDTIEDMDNDNDEIVNPFDECSPGELGWVSNSTTDMDGDGCRDDTEDADDDGDTVPDVMDDCMRGETRWTSSSFTDKDGDGCKDHTEDDDDDQDGIIDDEDGCPKEIGDSVYGGMQGCPDTDTDGWADALDEFPEDSTQWSDSDGDGFGDNPLGTDADDCPDTPGDNTTAPRRGCPPPQAPKPTEEDDGSNNGGDDAAVSQPSGDLSQSIIVQIACGVLFALVLLLGLSLYLRKASSDSK